MQSFASTAAYSAQAPFDAPYPVLKDTFLPFKYQPNMPPPLHK